MYWIVRVWYRFDVSPEDNGWGPWEDEGDGVESRIPIGEIFRFTYRVDSFGEARALEEQWREYLQSFGVEPWFKFSLFCFFYVFLGRGWGTCEMKAPKRKNQGQGQSLSYISAMKSTKVFAMSTTIGRVNTDGLGGG